MNETIAQALLYLGSRRLCVAKQLIDVKTCALCLPSNSARLPRMIEELIRNIRVIHDLERAIRVWELVRDSTQQVVNETTACYEKQGRFVATNPTAAKARADIATYNTAIPWGQGKNRRTGKRESGRGIGTALGRARAHLDTQHIISGRTAQCVLFCPFLCSNSVSAATICLLRIQIQVCSALLRRR
jgi:hypothetical protein